MGNAIKELSQQIIGLFKLTFLRVKVIFFFGYIGVFAYKYCLRYDENDKIIFDLSQDNLGAGELIITSLVVIFLILIDFLLLNKKNDRFTNLLKDPNVPDSTKEILAKDFINNR